MLLEVSMPLHKEVKEKVMKEFGINAQDTGSEYVQVAMLSERIDQLTEHLKINKKDFSSKKGLLQMISDRHGFLKYLKRKNETKYRQLITRLGLKG